MLLPIHIMRLEDLLNEHAPPITRRDALAALGILTLNALAHAETTTTRTSSTPQPACTPHFYGLNEISTPLHLPDGSLFLSSQTLTSRTIRITYPGPDGKIIVDPADSYFLALPGIPLDARLSQIDQVPTIPSSFIPSYDGPFIFPRGDAGKPTVFIRMTLPEGLRERGYPEVSAQYLTLTSRRGSVRMLNVTFHTPFQPLTHVTFFTAYLARRERNVYELIQLAPKEISWLYAHQPLIPSVEPARVLDASFSFLENTLLPFEHPISRKARKKKISVYENKGENLFSYARVLFTPREETVTIWPSIHHKTYYEKHPTTRKFFWRVNLSRPDVQYGRYLPISMTGHPLYLGGIIPFGGDFEPYPDVMGRTLQAYREAGCPKAYFTRLPWGSNWKGEDLL